VHSIGPTFTSIKSLQVLLVAPEQAVLSKAAITLHVLKHAVSQQIRHLEQQLDYALVIRSSKNLFGQSRGATIALYRTRIRII